MDINQVVLFGRVGKDPEIRATPGGDPFVAFSIANSTWKKDSTQESGWAEETSWFDCSLFGDAATRFVERTKKGHGVTVTGSLKQRTWEDKDGNKKERIQVIVRGIQYHEKKAKSAAPAEAPTERLEDVPF